MSRVAILDLKDALLQPLCETYLEDVEDWIIEQASAAGVEEADILTVLGKRAKRAAVLYLAVATCLGEAAQNQHTMGGDGKDVFLVKMGAYQKQLDRVMAAMTASDWSGSTADSDDTPTNLCAEIERG
jgi:hypothetical protein